MGGLIIAQAAFFFVVGIMLTAANLSLAFGPSHDAAFESNQARIAMIHITERERATALVILALMIMSGRWMIQGKRRGLMVAVAAGILSAIMGCGWGEFNFGNLHLFGNGIGSACGIGVALYGCLRLFFKVGPKLA